jgi:hypothetical protein
MVREALAIGDEEGLTLVELSAGVVGERST